MERVWLITPATVQPVTLGLGVIALIIPCRVTSTHVPAERRVLCWLDHMYVLQIVAKIIPQLHLSVVLKVLNFMPVCVVYNYEVE